MSFGKGNAQENAAWLHTAAEPFLAVADPEQAGGDGLIDTFYGYSDNGQRNSLTDDNRNVSTRTYDCAGHKKTETKGGSADSDPAAPTTMSGSYNEAPPLHGKIVSIIHFLWK